MLGKYLSTYVEPEVVEARATTLLTRPWMQYFDIKNDSSEIRGLCLMKYVSHKSHLQTKMISFHYKQNIQKLTPPFFDLEKNVHIYCVCTIELLELASSIK